MHFTVTNCQVPFSNLQRFFSFVGGHFATILLRVGGHFERADILQRFFSSWADILSGRTFCNDFFARGRTLGTGGHFATIFFFVGGHFERADILQRFFCSWADIRNGRTFCNGGHFATEQQPRVKPVLPNKLIQHLPCA